MRRSVLLLTAAVSCVVLAACGSSGGSPSSASAPSTTTSPTTAAPSPSASVTSPLLKVDPDTKPSVKPKEFSLGSFAAPAMSAITWSSWTPAGAVGVGTYDQFVCDPSCDDPKEVKTKARVTLTNVKKGRYTRMVFTSFTAKKIPGGTYTFDGRVWG